MPFRNREERQPQGPHDREAALVLKALFVSAFLLVATAAAADEFTCGVLKNATGPFDYRKPTGDTLQLVEQYHFTPDVEALRHGATGQIGDDLDYTLRVFPNHPRALAALVGLQFKLKTDRPRGTKWPVACYFDRAIRFVPDDGNVRVIWGVYLLRLGKTKEAIEQFNEATKLGEDSVTLHYNAGLAYFDLGDYEKSVEHAKRAYALGTALPGLKKMLVKAGKWPSD